MKWSAFVLSGLLSLQAFSLGLLTTALENHFDPKKAPRVGIEVELAGLSVEKITDILSTVLGGEKDTVVVIEQDTNSTSGQMETFRVIQKKLKNTLIGNILIKPEDNSTDNSNLKSNYAQTNIVEIVTQPLFYGQVLLLQRALIALKSHGAYGTEHGFAISIQANIEMAGGRREDIKVENVLNIMRNYLKPSNRKDIADELNVPSFRKKYLGEYSEGMMSRILDSNYNPTWKEFYLDFMYRQSLERLGNPKAWTMSAERARWTLRNILKTQSFEVLLPVVKWNFIRASSLFMYMQPDDWLTGYLIGTGWFHAYPILEFREPNNDFNLKIIDKIIGFVQASEQLGEFEHGTPEQLNFSFMPSCEKLLLQKHAN